MRLVPKDVMAFWDTLGKMVKFYRFNIFYGA